MPEYLAPGVYVEETSFRSKSLEGVSTSTAGFVGPTRYGPVSGDPELITSFLDFQRIFGGLDDLELSNVRQPNYLAHAVRAFFEEGGRRLFVSRVFGFASDAQDDDGIWTKHFGHTDTGGLSPTLGVIVLHARFPGAASNMRLTLTLKVGANALNAGGAGGSPSLTRVSSFDVVHVATPIVANGRTTGWAPHGGTDGLFVATWDALNERWILAGNGSDILLTALAAGTNVRPLSVVVEVAQPEVGSTGFKPAELLGEFGFDGRSSAALITTFAKKPLTRNDFLTVPFALEVPADMTIDGTETDEATRSAKTLDFVRELIGFAVTDTLRRGRDVRPEERRAVYTLEGGDDGEVPGDEEFVGIEDSTLFTDYIADPLLLPKNGLLAFDGVEDISIVAAPGYTHGYADSGDPFDRVIGIQNAVINHCEKMRYRIAVLDTPSDFLPTQALNYRNLRSSKYAAIYYPWVTVANPLGEGRIDLPPSGFMAGIYARNDIEHAVFKAPANEVVRSAIDFQLRLNKAHQELLNPQGVNCLRYFPGHGFLVWGARTISDDPEWKYVNIRRYFAYLERTIDRGTQWVVFEPNSPQLWDNVRRTVEDFLFNEWKMGALLGDKPEQAYFVRCDRSTMTQNDLDNGRLICLIGVAVVKPAEFVIFRIGQWTATSNA
jgi:uncharacterized protein